MTEGAGKGQLDALFRREAGRLTSALVRVFGPHNLPLVEDVVHDALVRALDVWKYGGVPDNPAAWLMTAAKHRAIDVLRRERRVQSVEGDLEPAGGTSAVPEMDDAFQDEALKDDELRMMFACCHARLPEEVRVALVLNLLCGFGVAEIAAAFFVSPAAMEKRLQRGKQVLGEAKGLLEVTHERVAENLETVHGALYLLFNEGYHGNHPTETVRVELCAEAIRLTTLLADSPAIARPATFALLALLCLTVARVPGRVGEDFELVPLAEQDRSKWDQGLIARGTRALEASASGDEVSPYHVEAAIAYEHTIARSHAETRFERILALYDSLYAMRPSPIVALSRAIALGEVHGPERALEVLRDVEDKASLERSPFYAAAIGEQEARAGHAGAAREWFGQALGLARSAAERRFLERRVAKLR